MEAMIDISSFLMRWFFLCNLIRDAAEIRTLPCIPYSPRHPNSHQPHSNCSHYSPIEYAGHGNGQQHNNNMPQAHYVYYQSRQEHLQRYPVVANQPVPYRNTEEEWRDHCLRGILSYPCGTQRMLVMDAMRAELVQQLYQFLLHVDSTARRVREFSLPQSNVAYDKIAEEKIHSLTLNHSNQNEGSHDPIITAGGIETPESSGLQSNIFKDVGDKSVMNASTKSKQMIWNGAGDPGGLTEEAIESSTKQIREYLPQIVSAVLKSPPPFDPNLVDPVHKLRALVISRCQQDPSWGIELCWLLEAEVGRAWKSLFEHRQQTGRRLIVVLPADKAVVLAKIGTEKREAFDLLQDVERVTAYGFSSDNFWHGDGSTTNLPSSRSLWRCSHFGDTMHFIDRLTRISLDLREVPAISRHDYLHQALHEMNRRLRRRMATRGEISLDVEDNLGPYDWPGLKDLTLDMLKHSVHFPLVPDRETWPSGTAQGTDEESKAGVMRVLNIVVPESRILSSRERCPYLVRLEVAETGLEGSDSLLFASDLAPGGVTVEESLSMDSYRPSTDNVQSSSDACEIPPELVESGGSGQCHAHLPRGGWQAEAEGAEFMKSTPYDMVRQREYEQLHLHMQDTQVSPPTTQVVTIGRPTVTTGEALLNRVYGRPWLQVCDDVRRTSPYGHVKGWRLASFILKAGEDIRREALVMQLISKFRDWFEVEIPKEFRPYLRPYTIMCVGGDAGLVECLTDAKSIDEVKKNTDGFVSLRDYFERAYGSPQSPSSQLQRGGAMPHVPGPQHSFHQQTGWTASAGCGLTFEQAQDNFLRSLVGYSLLCYILQIKDRHNANILLDRFGHIMHIDFGFVLGDTPRMGKVPLFSEKAPFKLSGEFWEVLGGWNLIAGGLGVRFCKMFEAAFACASAHSEEVATLIEGIMLTLTDNAEKARSTANRVRSRLRMRGLPNSSDQKRFIMDLVNTALTSWGTSTYDWLQKNMNGYE